jgi:hypothetical protein
VYISNSDQTRTSTALFHSLTFEVLYSISQSGSRIVYALFLLDLENPRFPATDSSDRNPLFRFHLDSRHNTKLRRRAHSHHNLHQTLKGISGLSGQFLVWLYFGEMKIYSVKRGSLCRQHRHLPNPLNLLSFPPFSHLRTCSLRISIPKCSQGHQRMRIVTLRMRSGMSPGIKYRYLGWTSPGATNPILKEREKLSLL